MKGAFRLTGYRRSVVRRFSLLLVAAAILPTVAAGLVYDRYARSPCGLRVGHHLEELRRQRGAPKRWR